jgi:hypothetical protein
MTHIQLRGSRRQRTAEVTTTSIPSTRRDIVEITCCGVVIVRRAPGSGPLW